MATRLAGMAVAGLPLSSRFGGAGHSGAAALLPYGLRGARRGRPPRLLAAPAGVRLARGDGGGSHSPSPVPSSCLGGGGGVGPVRWIQSWAAGSGAHAAGFGAPAPGSGSLSKGWRGRCLAKAEAAAATAKGVGTGALLPVLMPLGRGRRPRGWGTCLVVADVGSQRRQHVPRAGDCGRLKALVVRRCFASSGVRSGSKLPGRRGVTADAAVRLLRAAGTSRPL
ncbi:uncharacterized protein [Miscanthus floridulus]|uniref:uncharacterized protein n=1 Tax=Miscanthus floridulus TaxID=154761 RepID=UPI0034578019